MGSGHYKATGIGEKDAGDRASLHTSTPIAYIGCMNRSLPLILLVACVSGTQLAAQNAARPEYVARFEDGTMIQDGTDTMEYFEARHPERPMLPSTPVLRAVAWLLEHQADDGTWTTPSRGLSTAASSRTDEVYRYWGTAWAVIGLASVADETL